jgi:hypothetical protein
VQRRQSGPHTVSGLRLKHNRREGSFEARQGYLAISVAVRTLSHLSWRARSRGRQGSNAGNTGLIGQPGEDATQQADEPSARST